MESKRHICIYIYRFNKKNETLTEPWDEYMVQMNE